MYPSHTSPSALGRIARHPLGLFGGSWGRERPRPGGPMQLATRTLGPAQRIARSPQVGGDTAGNLTGRMRVVGIDDANAAGTGIERISRVHFELNRGPGKMLAT